MVHSVSILVANEPGKVIQVPCHGHEPVFFLLQRLRIKLGLEEEAVVRHQLAINGIVLNDQNASLAYYRIFGGSIAYKFVSKYSFMIHVKTLMGKTINVHCRATNTIGEIKELINTLQGMPPDQQRLIFEGNQLQDDRTLLEYNVQKGSIIHLVLRLTGGGVLPSFILEFADVSDKSNVRKIEFSETAPPGRVVEPGINIECRCDCTPKYHVISRKGFAIVEMTRERFACPVCHESHRNIPVTVGFTDCQYRFMGLKLSGEQYTSEWFDVPPEDEYQRFDPGKQTTWSRLMIQSKPRFESDNCIVCLESSHGVQTYGCGHTYHKKCHDSIGGLCFSCKFEKQLQALSA